MSDEAIRVDLSRLRDVKPLHLAIRFGFGAGISTLAALVSIWFGARVGGALLAFPAILPATITLIAEQQSQQDADETAIGALVGAPALPAFAVVVAVLTTVIGTALALGVAAAAWCAVAAGLFVMSQRLRLAAARRWVTRRAPDASAMTGT